MVNLEPKKLVLLRIWQIFIKTAIRLLRPKARINNVDVLAAEHLKERIEEI